MHPKRADVRRRQGTFDIKGDDVHRRAAGIGRCDLHNDATTLQTDIAQDAQIGDRQNGNFRIDDTVESFSCSRQPFYHVAPG